MHRIGVQNLGGGPAAQLVKIRLGPMNQENPDVAGFHALEGTWGRLPLKVGGVYLLYAGEEHSGEIFIIVDGAKPGDIIAVPSEFGVNKTRFWEDYRVD